MRYFLIAALAIAMASAPYTAGATCLTASQLDYIDQLAITLNASASELRAFFEPMCDMGAYYTRDETDQIMDLTMQSVTLNLNVSQLQTSIKLNDTVNAVNGTIDARLKPYQDNWSAHLANMSAKVDAAMSTQNLTLAISALAEILQAQKALEQSNSTMTAQMNALESRMNTVLSNMDSKYALKSEVSQQPSYIQAAAPPDYMTWGAVAFFMIVIAAFLFFKFRSRIPAGYAGWPQKDAPVERPLVTDMPRTRAEAAGVRAAPNPSAPIDEPDVVPRLAKRKR